MKSVANLYNPHEQSKEELIAGFVVRLQTFENLFKEIKNSDMRYPEQHYLIEGQRGMGKTTLLLRLSYEIENDAELNSWLIPLVFKEESYWSINRLFKLWEHCAQLLADEESDFKHLPEQMRSLPDTDYERACFSLLINTLEQQQKKMLIFIDNIGEMFQSFNLQESQRLREVLLNCPQLRIIGATSITLESYFDYKHPFYEFFKKITLPTLNKEETYQLLQALAKGGNDEQTIKTIIKQQTGRVESLRILTGGVIRSIVLLFEIFLDNNNGDSLKDLDLVLDKVTPLYKHRMDDLNYLQREIVDTIALRWDAISPEEIAAQTRRDLLEVSPVLIELTNLFIIQRVPTTTDTDYYQLQERFFNIWYLMRVAPRHSQAKVLWLVRFLQCWYDTDGLKKRAERQIGILQSGLYHPKAAFYLTKAMISTGLLESNIEYKLLQSTRAFLENSDKSLLEDLPIEDKKVDYLMAIEKGHVAAMNNLALLYHDQEQDYPQAKKYYLMAIEKGDVSAMFNLALLYHNQEQDYPQAKKYYLMAIEKGHVGAMNNLAVLYNRQEQDYPQAKKYYLMAIEKGQVGAMFNLALLYHTQEQDYPQAKKYYLMAIEKGHVDAMFNLALLYHDQEQDYPQAKKYYLMAIEKGHVDAMFNLAWLYHSQEQDCLQAKKYYLMAIEKGDVSAMNNLALLYHHQEQDYPQAKKYSLMAIEKGHVDAMNNLALLYNRQEQDYPQAKKYYLMAIEKGHVDAMFNLAWLYHSQEQDCPQAKKYYLMAIEKGHVDAMFNLAWLYFQQHENKQDALTLAEQALTKESHPFIRHILAYIYLWHNQFEKATDLANIFLYDKEFYKNYEGVVIIYLNLLLAKQQFTTIKNYFNTPESDYAERFKPLYYAFLKLTDNADYAKIPPELSEPVADVIAKIEQMRMDYV